MGGDGDHRPPYDAARALSAFAWEHKSYVEGRIAVSGGNPDTMSLRLFLAAAYSILVDGYRQFNMDLLTAVEKVNESLGITPAAVPAEAPAGSDNTLALRQLETMMGGL